MCKKLGHGSNYRGQPKTLAQQAKLPEAVVRDFQPKYFGAFPSHLQWHANIETTLRTVGKLTTLTGRPRWFFGRRNDPATLREAIAYDPQGSLADIVNRAMLRLWRERNAILVFQDHDALTFMYPEDAESDVIPLLQASLTETIALKHGRTMTIPYDCKVGFNKGDWSETNPDGLKDWTGEDKRQRTPTPTLLDRIIR
jgi:DNA polymerase I-like protein with 3'-5' exonuclease and polymerase domains